MQSGASFGALQTSSVALAHPFRIRNSRHLSLRAKSQTLKKNTRLSLFVIPPAIGCIRTVTLARAVMMAGIVERWRQPAASASGVPLEVWPTAGTARRPCLNVFPIFHSRLYSMWIEPGAGCAACSACWARHSKTESGMSRQQSQVQTVPNIA